MINWLVFAVCLVAQIVNCIGLNIKNKDLGIDLCNYSFLIICVIVGLLALKVL